MLRTVGEVCVGCVCVDGGRRRGIRGWLETGGSVCTGHHTGSKDLKRCASNWYMFGFIFMRVEKSFLYLSERIENSSFSQ